MKKTIFSSLLAAWLFAAAGCTETDLYSNEVLSPAVGIDDTELVLDGKAESGRIFIQSNLWWKAHLEYDGAEEWLTISPDRGFGNIEIEVAAGRNYQLSQAKKARLVIESDSEGSSFRKEFDVLQNPSEAYIEVAGVEEQLLTSVTRNVTELTVHANDAWEAVTSDNSWCMVETDSYTNGRHLVRLICEVNATHQPRTAVVTFRTKSGAQQAFEVVQSDAFAVPVLVLTKDAEGRISLAWDEILGAANYQIVLKNGAETIAEIDNGSATTCDLSAAPVFADPQYVGAFSVLVRAVSDEPTIFSESNTEESCSHFASGSGTAADPFVIDGPHYLRNIALVNPIAAGCHYRLDYTPVLDAAFEPICTPAAPFSGIFDGNGKTISGWIVTLLADNRNYIGFFGGIDKGAEVSDLNFEKCSLYLTNDGGKVSSTNNGFAWVTGTNKGTIRNIRVINCTIGCEAGTTPLNVGGIAANNDGTISGCSVSGAISAASDRNKNDVFDCGGIAAYNNGTVDNCTNDAPIVAMNQVGGIVGMNGGTVKNCVNNGNITANYYFGGVVGYTTSSSATCIIEHCGNTGTLTMDEPSGQSRGAAYMGGVTSRIYSNNTTISKCWNTGDLIVGVSSSSSALRIGGIVGHTNKPGSLTDSYNAGNFTIAGNVNCGGIVGEMAAQKVVITNCYSVGKATMEDGGKGNVAAAFGKADGSAIITNCYALDSGLSFALGTTSGITGGGLLSDSAMQNPASFAGWDFSGTWQQGSGAYPYPVLR